MKCSHSLVYRQFLAGPPSCLICHPPKKASRKIGLLFKGGRILSSNDISKSIRYRNKQFIEKSAKDFLKPYLGQMTVIHPKQNWSFKPDKTTTFRLIGEIFPSKPTQIPSSGLKSRPGSPNYIMKSDAEVEAAKEEYVNFLFSQMEKAAKLGEKFVTADCPAFRKAKWRFKRVMKEKKEEERKKKGRKRNRKYKLKGDPE